MQTQLINLDNTAKTGFRLDGLEVFNWGTFNKKIWIAQPQGNNSLLTGDIGSGKSTIVDGLTTLLVANQKITYNKAAGAEGRERNLTSYVRGYYKSAKDDTTLSAKAVALRDHNSYSVLLARFVNADFKQTITLAQVFWLRDNANTPERFYIVACKYLSIAEHFSDFGSDISDLKKKLKRQSQLKFFDSFSQYQAEFRRQMGIENDQAMDLLYQTVSMKSVGNLTEFVRSHMLESTNVQEHLDKLIQQFDNLNRSHEAVLKSRQQIDKLKPLVADCKRFNEIEKIINNLRQCRETLYGYFAYKKINLLNQRISRKEIEYNKCEIKLEEIQKALVELRIKLREIEAAIYQNGGKRLAELKTEIERLSIERERLAKACDSYLNICSELNIAHPKNNNEFYNNRIVAEKQLMELTTEQAKIQNQQVEHAVKLKQTQAEHQELITEINSLEKRKSNIPSRNLAIRDTLCEKLSLSKNSLPFAGELLQIRQEEKLWEGVAERVLHNFAMSLLVADEHYEAVANYVNKTHLQGRLVYYRIRKLQQKPQNTVDNRSLSTKIAIKTNTIFYEWLEQELINRFNYICCDTMEAFSRERQAITSSGQIKTNGSRHEKDDRFLINDRSRFVLGWSNQEKIVALKNEASIKEKTIQQATIRQTVFNATLKKLNASQLQLNLLLNYEAFNEIDWHVIAIKIQTFKDEQQQLESGSDILKTLKNQHSSTETIIDNKQKQERELAKEIGALNARLEQYKFELEQSQTQLNELETRQQEHYFPQLKTMEKTALADKKLSIENCHQAQISMRQWLSSKIDSKQSSSKNLISKITGQMSDYKNAYPQETKEIDADVAAATEFFTMLTSLEKEDLPRHEQRFKQMLNEGAIHNMAMFQSWLDQQQQSIREKINTINKSLATIDYSESSYIRLVADNNRDVEINQFKVDLRNCLGDTLTADETETYTEHKFLQVKAIIERFNGREGQTDLDKRWSRKVTDVRNWFLFNVSERYREDDSEKEFYSDTAGKSGGQKEKLAYTILAAALAYQFGLKWGETHSRSFRFVMIDEAFGRGSDESARYGLELFRKLNLQLLIVTPLQKIHIIEDYVNSVHFVHNEAGRNSILQNLTIAEYQQNKAKYQHEQQATTKIKEINIEIPEMLTND